MGNFEQIKQGIGGSAVSLTTAQSWYVSMTDGTNVLGTIAHPVVVSAGGGNFPDNIVQYASQNVVTNGVNGLIATGNYGASGTSDASWTSATTVNTAVVLVSNLTGYSSVAVTLNQAPTGTLTGGVVTFQISNDGTNWYNTVGVDPATAVVIGPNYTLVAAAYNIFQFSLEMPYFRVLLSTAITGSGTVTVGHAVSSLPRVHNLAGLVTVSATLGAAYNSTLPTVPSGTTNVLQIDSRGQLLTDQNYWAGNALGAPSAYGTSPGAVVVPGVNAFITNAVTVGGGAASGSPVSGNPVLVAGSDGTNAQTILTSSTGQVHVLVDGGVTQYSNGTAAATPTGAQIMGWDGTDVWALSAKHLTNANALTVGIVDGSGNQITSFGGGIQYATGTAVATPTGTAALGWDGTDVRVISTNSSGQQYVLFPSAQAVTLTSTTISSGTITANQGGAPWTVVPDGTVWGLTGTSANVDVTNTVTVTGTVATTFPASPIVWIKGNAGATLDATIAPATAPTNGVATLGVFNNTAPTPTDTQSLAQQLDQSGNQRVASGIVAKTLSAQGTALNSAQTILSNSGCKAVVIQLTQTSTLTAGAVTFELSYDFITGSPTWTVVPTYFCIDPTNPNVAKINLPYTVVPSTNQQFLIQMNGAQALRIRTSTAITGTGSVTPTYALLDYCPLQWVSVTSPYNVGVVVSEQGAPTSVNLPWEVRLSDGTNDMGVMTNFGSTPGAVKAPGVNSSVFYGTTAASNTTAGIPDFNLKNIGNSAVSAASAQLGANIYASGTALTVTGSSLNVNLTGGISNTQYATGSTQATPTGTVALGWDGTVVKALPLDSNGYLEVNAIAAANVGVPGTTIPGYANYIGWLSSGNLVGVSSVNPLPVSATLSGNVGTNLTQVNSQTVTTTGVNGEQKVGIVGSTGATIDSAVASSTPPTNAVAVSGIYNFPTAPAPTNQQANMLQQDQAANLLTFPGVQFETGAVWGTGTGLNTKQYPRGQTTTGQNVGAIAVLCQLDMSNSTFTAGAVTFQVTYDNINWVTLPTAQVLNPQTFAQLTNPYTFVTNSQVPFLLVLQGAVNVRAELSTQITGSSTPTVTPYWTTLSELQLPSSASIVGVIEVSPTGAANTLSNPFFNVLADNAGHALTVNGTTTASAFALDHNILSILGTAPTTAGKLDVKGADGDVFVRQATAANLNCTAVLAAGSAVIGHVIVDSFGTTIDVSDRAARLLGVVYGSQGQQIKQTATNYNLASEIYVGGSAIDPRSIRALTSSDVVTVQAINSALPAGSNNIGGVELIDAGGTNKATIKPANTGAVANDTSLVVTSSPMSGIPVSTPSGHNSATTVKTTNVASVVVAAHQTVIVTVSSGNYNSTNWTAAVSDGTNTYVLDRGAVFGSSAWAGVFRATNCAAGTYTITFTISGSNSSNTTVAMQVYIVDGLLEPASPLDQNAQGSSSGSTAASTSTVTPQGPNEYAFAALAAAGAETSITAGGSWAADYTLNDSVCSFGSFSQLLPSMAGISGSATLASSVVWVMALVTYRTPAENIAGTVQIGGGGVAQVVGVVYDSSGNQHPLLQISFSGITTTTTEVAAVASQKVYVYAFKYSVNGTVNVQLQSHTTTTNCTGLDYFVINQGAVYPWNPGAWMATTAGEGLDVSLSASTATSGCITYAQY